MRHLFTWALSLMIVVVSYDAFAVDPIRPVGPCPDAMLRLKKEASAAARRRSGTREENREEANKGEPVEISESSQLLASLEPRHHKTFNDLRFNMNHVMLLYETLAEQNLEKLKALAELGPEEIMKRIREHQETRLKFIRAGIR